MQIRERAEGEVKKLRSMARSEPRAEQKDRLTAAALAVEQMETLDIQRSLCRSRGFVQRWAYAYRDSGIGALKTKPRGGSITKISGEEAQCLRARLDAGPTEADGVCTLRGRDIQRIAREELAPASGSAACTARWSGWGTPCLAPRPRHERRDPAAQEKFKADTAPFLSAPSGS